MRARYVVDTNVLIAASAADPVAPADISATPDDPALRLRIWDWLAKFSENDSRMVMDWDMEIHREYHNKLSYSDFGIQVVIDKMSRDQVDYVAVYYDHDGHGILTDTLEPVVHDLADRKMVAAAIEAHTNYGEGCIAFAGDTDWHEWENALSDHHIILEPIIEEWSRAKHAEKAAKN